MSDFDFLLFGHDTVEAAYWLATTGSGIDFEALDATREEMRLGRGKDRRGKAVMLGGAEFLLRPYGSSSGFPFVIDCPDYSISFGLYNAPSFFVKFTSLGLWSKGALALHDQFMAWANGLKLHSMRAESLSRVDWAFDYLLPVLDFDEDSFVTELALDERHRRNRKVRTMSFGKGDLRIRTYDKIAEIQEKSHKTWFHKLWDHDSDVWRIEAQARKALLQRFGLRTFGDLADQQGDLLTWLAKENTSLRIPTGDSNRSRWPLHPLWQDLQERVATLPRQGVVEEIPLGATLEERILRCVVAMYGYAKRVAALEGLRAGQERAISLEETLGRLTGLLRGYHDPLTWKAEVLRRMTETRLTPW